MEVYRGAQRSQIEAEDNGGIRLVMVGVPTGIVVALDETEEAEDSMVLLEGHLTLSHAAFVGFMALWHKIEAEKHLSLRVVIVAPLKEVHQDLGNKAQEMDDEDSRFVLKA